MSTDEIIEETSKKGVNLNVKMSPGIMVTIIISIIGGIITITRFADSKTSREDVEHIVDTKLERVMGRIESIGSSVDDIKETLKNWQAQ